MAPNRDDLVVATKYTLGRAAGGGSFGIGSASHQRQFLSRQSIAKNSTAASTTSTERAPGKKFCDRSEADHGEVAHLSSCGGCRCREGVRPGTSHDNWV
jgi:hypothetical protein